MQCTPGFFDLLVAGFVGRVGHHAGLVVVAGAVGVVGVEIEMDTGVAVVVLLAPACAHPVADLGGRQVAAGDQDVHLAGCGGVEQADLPHREHLALAWALGDVEGDLGVGESPGVGAAEFVGVDALGEQCLFDVGGGTFAPGQGVEPGRVQVGEQGRGPAAAVEPDQHPAIVADGGAQLGDQPAQLRRQRGGRFGHHHQQRIPRGVAHPGFHRGRGGELNRGTWVFAIARVPR